MSEYRRIRVEPLSGALGADVLGVDLSAPLDDETFEEVHRAFLEHLVLFFHDQHLDKEQHKAFARRFGPLNVHPFVKASADPTADPEVLEIVREPDQTYVFGGSLWHMDHTWRETPLLGAILYAKEVPAYGGDTIFANLYKAYETLSPGLRKMLERLTGVHTPPPGEYTRDSNVKVTDDDIDRVVAEHPVVRTHPETGQKALFVHSAITRRFKDMTEEESQPLLQYLCDHAIRPEFTCRIRWEPGAVVFWDNRCTLHYPIDDYFGQRRVMNRIAIEGDRPYL